MSDNKNMTNEEELEKVAGGSVTPDEIHNLRNFVTRTVGNLPYGTFLVMQSRPGGSFMSQQYTNGEPILINAFYSEAGYLLAFRNGVYGFVDARYVI